MQVEHKFNVAGVHFDNRQMILSRLTGEEKVIIKPEPTNAFDFNALAVYIEFANTKPAALGKPTQYQVGYVPRQLAAMLAPRMNGKEVEGRIARIAKPPQPGMDYGLVIAMPEV